MDVGGLFPMAILGLAATQLRRSLQSAVEAVEAVSIGGDKESVISGT